MKIARLLSPVHSLGPGERVCMWVQGCSKGCRGCISPEMQPAVGKEIQEHMLADIVRKAADLGKCKGLTISGGDPFEQPESLLTFLNEVKDFFADILVYTGYRIEEIQNGSASGSGIACLDKIDVLIDGRYVEELNHSSCILRGSENQLIHYLNPAVRQTYEDYMKAGRILEPFIHNNRLIVTGILDRERIE